MPPAPPTSPTPSCAFWLAGNGIHFIHGEIMTTYNQVGGIYTPPPTLPVDAYNLGVATALNATSATLIKSTPGRLARIDVVVAGSTAGATYDTNSTSSTAASNQICAIPNTVGPIWLDWPAQVGIVLSPGTGQTLAIAYY
jgi:hypothetical protein